MVLEIEVKKKKKKKKEKKRKRGKRDIIVRIKINPKLIKPN